MSGKTYAGRTFRLSGVLVAPGAAYSKCPTGSCIGPAGLAEHHERPDLRNGPGEFLHTRAGGVVRAARSAAGRNPLGDGETRGHGRRRAVADVHLDRARFDAGLTGVVVEADVVGGEGERHRPLRTGCQGDPLEAPELADRLHDAGDWIGGGS